MTTATYGPQFCPLCNDQTPKPVTGEWDWGVHNEQTLIQLACGHKFTFLKERESNAHTDR